MQEVELADRVVSRYRTPTASAFLIHETAALRKGVIGQRQPSPRDVAGGCNAARSSREVLGVTWRMYQAS